MNNKDNKRNIKGQSFAKNNFEKNKNTSSKNINTPNEKKSIKINKGDIYNNSNLNINKERSNHNTKVHANEFWMIEPEIAFLLEGGYSLQGMTQFHL